MYNCETLAWYGGLVLLVTGCFILVPYLRSKADLISARNFLLLGIAIFVGLGGFEAALSPMRFPGLEWFQPTNLEVNWFLAATTVFLVVLLTTYYVDPFSRKIAARAFNMWPPITTGTLLLVFGICIVCVALSTVPALLRMTFVGPFLTKVSHKSLVFACVFSFVLWYRQKLNIGWLMLFIVVLSAMCVSAMVYSTGRRLLLSVLVGPVLVVYFAHARHWRPSKGVIVVAVAALALFFVNLMYSSMRHFRAEERTTRTVLEQVKAIRSSGWLERFTRDRLFHFSQQAVHYALLTQRFVDEGRLTPRPLNTLAILVTYPIPRNVWPNKPQILGITITHDVIRWSTTNWGCGISGQAIYEGGLLPAALYAYLVVYMIRLFDDPLRRQPTNPFLVAMLASAAPHLMGWARGDLGIMTLNCIECFFFTIALAWIARAFFGTERAAWSAPWVGGVTYPAYRFRS
jgi:hypothetical protein